jgi:NitT/TauT family transport system substrate-binding protein
MTTRRAALILLGSIVLAACTRREATPVAKNALKRVQVNVNPTLTYAPMMIAQEEGFFAKEGIDAEFVSLDSNSAVAAAAAGKLDVLSIGVRAGAFNLMLKGVPLQIVADKGHSTAACAAEAFIAPVATAQRIAAAGGSVRGERLSFVRGGVNEFLTMKLLERHGLTTADVTIIQMPQGSAASSRDKLDAVRLTTEPNVSAALAEGWAAIVATPQELVPDHQTSILLYGKRLLRDDPALGEAFMRAYLRGVRQYNQGKTERNVAILSKHTKLPPDVIRRACWMAITNDGRIPPERIQPFLEWALANHFLDGSITPAQWWTPRFVDAANNSIQP